MTFPLDGETRLTDSFGDCRGSGCSRAHEGVDIMTAKGVPVLAAGDGVVSWISSGPGDCCYLGIEHGGGWVTRYIHLNDDAKDPAGTYIDNTDGQGWGIAEGLAEGIAVTRGQVIGWAGDSGNAAETVSHLHFELRKNGTPIDAYPYLVNALGGWDGRFQDDDGNVHEKNIEVIAQRGITLGCNPPLNNRFCPEDQITRGQMAAFIARALELPEGGEIPYTDVVGNKFEPAIRAIEAAGIGFGCTKTEFCPGVPLLRHEMAGALGTGLRLRRPDRHKLLRRRRGQSVRGLDQRPRRPPCHHGVQPAGQYQVLPGHAAETIADGHFLRPGDALAHYSTTS